MLQYRLFYTGLASTPNSVGLICSTTNEIICQISTYRESGKETRKAYQKMIGILNQKYSTIAKINLVN